MDTASTAGSMASYAAMGAAIGGPWGAAAGAVVGLVSSLISSGEQREQQNKMVDAAIKANEAKTKLIMQEAARSAGEINRQRTLAYVQTAQAMQHIQKEGGAGTAQANLQVAVTEAIGASAGAVKSDIDHQMNEAQAQLEFNAETQQENINQSLIGMLNQARSSFTPVSTQGLQQQSSGWGSALMAVGQGIMAYKGAGGTFGSSAAAAPKMNAAPTTWNSIGGNQGNLWAK